MLLPYPGLQTARPELERARRDVELAVIDRAFRHFTQIINPTVEELDRAVRRIRDLASSVEWAGPLLITPSRTLGGDYMRRAGSALVRAKDTGGKWPSLSNLSSRWKAKKDEMRRRHIEWLDKPLVEVRNHFYGIIDIKLPIRETPQAR
jgi:hypothetical protein